jgi:hypothetical protein
MFMDKVVLPGSRPPLDPFFSQDCGVHGFMTLEPYQPLYMVLLREASDETFAVLPDASDEIRRDASVESAVGRFCKNIDAGHLFHPSS